MNRQTHLDAQEHDTEYGMHWNFFITLGLLPVLQVMVHPLIRLVPISLVGILVAICKSKFYRSHSTQTTNTFFSVHQISLSFLGMQSFILYAPRTNIISANKEGIVSLSGRPFLSLPISTSD
jgi:phosphatidylinositol glycan class W